MKKELPKNKTIIDGKYYCLLCEGEISEEECKENFGCCKDCQWIFCSYLHHKEGFEKQFSKWKENNDNYFGNPLKK